MKKKPFALIGVNSWSSSPAELKEVMTREQINWRSFADEGTINRQWNRPATPAYYLIDHQGVIRRKWVGYPGETTIETALEKLIQDMEESQ